MSPFNPQFLDKEEILFIHADQIERYGGGLGVRDDGLLESAIAQPRATFGGQWLHPTLFEMAAAYLFHLVENHPFLDGNKRVGTAAAIVFLKINGLSIKVTDEEMTNFVLEVAQGRIDKSAIAEFLRSHATYRLT
ncbi:MAG: type II toxin-antitoxin system death-on-curing family toxin [Planctomycetota bacterium]